MRGPLQAPPLPAESGTGRRRARRGGLTHLRADMAAAALLLLLLCAVAGPGRCWDQPGEMRGAGYTSARPSAAPSASPVAMAAFAAGWGFSRPSAAQRCRVSGGLVRRRGRAGACGEGALGFGLPLNRLVPQWSFHSGVNGGYILRVE